MNFIDFLALIPLFLTILLESIKDLAIMGKAGEKNLRIFFCKKQIVLQVGFLYSSIATCNLLIPLFILFGKNRISQGLIS